MKREPKILAVASAGGHWTQMMRLRPAFRDCEVVLVSTLDFSASVPGSKFYVVPEANRQEKAALVRLAISLAGIVLRERPTIIISTGAAPGLIALYLGRLIWARTIWIDSLANVDRLSMSGKIARWTTDLWLTQWPHLARPKGPRHFGAVI